MSDIWNFNIPRRAPGQPLPIPQHDPLGLRPPRAPIANMAALPTPVQNPATPFLLQPRNAGLGAVAAALLQARAPSTDPAQASFAGALGKAAQAGMGAYERAAQGQLQRQLVQQQLARGRREKAAATMAAGEAAKRRQQIALLRKLPKYAHLADRPDKEFMEAISRDPVKLGAAETLIDPTTGETMFGGPTGNAKINRLMTDEERSAYAPHATEYEAYYWDAKGNPKRMEGGKGAYIIEGDLQKQLKPYKDGADKVMRGAKIVSSALDKKTGPSDIVAIKSFERMIEDSVVRSDDIEMQARAVGLKQRLDLLLKNWTEGQLLGDTTRQQMRAMADEILSITMEGSVLPNVEELVERAGKYRGVTRGKVISDKRLAKIRDWRGLLRKKARPALNTAIPAPGFTSEDWRYLTPQERQKAWDYGGPG